MSLLYQVIAAFGGGIFGALIGATNAFVLVGFTGLAGIVLSIGGGGDALLNSVAIGPYLVPHVGFASGVAALAVINNNKNKFMKKYEKTEDLEEKKEMSGEFESYKEINGTSVFAPLHPFADVTSMLIAGLFGAGGYLLNYSFSEVLNLPVDTVAFTIVISNIIVRLFIAQGSINKFEGIDFYKNINNKLLYNIVWAAPLAFVTSYVTLATGEPLIVFYISAFSLLLLSVGKIIPVTHHITLPAGYAAIATNNIWIGMLVGLVGMILGEYFDETVNKNADSLFDMPSFIIALLSFVIFTLF